MSSNVFWSPGKITPAQRELRNGHPGCVIWLTGLSASGKSTIAVELERELFHRGIQTCMLDGDNVRHGLCSDLGVSPEARKENIRRIGAVAKLFADAGLICITAFISPYRSDRALARSIAPGGKFYEVYVNAPLAVCESLAGRFRHARQYAPHRFAEIAGGEERRSGRQDAQQRLGQLGQQRKVEAVEQPGIGRRPFVAGRQQLGERR